MATSKSPPPSPENEFDPRRQWPNISTQLFDASVQRSVFFGYLSWGVIIVAGLMYSISRFAHEHGFPNIADYTGQLYAFIMTGGVGTAIVGMYGGWKAMKFAYSQQAGTVYASKRQAKKTRKTVWLGMGCSFAALFTILVLAL